MKKIAILRCMNVSNSCTGSGCLKAWNGRDRAFAGYAEEDQLISFFHCNGCDCDPATNEGMQKKLNRLQKMASPSCIPVIALYEIRNLVFVVQKSTRSFNCSRNGELKLFMEPIISKLSIRQ